MNDCLIKLVMLWPFSGFRETEKDHGKIYKRDKKGKEKL